MGVGHGGKGADGKRAGLHDFTQNKDADAAQCAHGDGSFSPRSSVFPLLRLKRFGLG